MSLGDFMYQVAVSPFGGWVTFGAIGIFLSVASNEFFRSLKERRLNKPKK